MKIYFATGNSGKVEHAQNILSECEVEQLDVETVEPQSGSIEEIALSKVKQVVEKSDLEDSTFLIADDSGLFVDSLNGFPGPLSSPFDSMVGKERLLDLVDPGADAKFRAAIALHVPDGEDRVFTGKVEGEIVEPRGEGGFGYDPLFLPEGNDKTWGEDPEFKDENSHREEALIQLKEFIERKY
ncbi:non-canonical purine NTP pyrophosphatase [Candidatus Nanohalobium constans]|uniref:Inosine/xanthosine triphosphate pyrophosphatase,all-alpha NTP-PPase family n=1 Tax=Candidatus Nanohalobium constans TaxID=2565781 RepID=A0A5Q0UHH9_9ARCH|nr:non-canonical purine NTP pyrophosphatase [Candidatus Nanohalobium constans]QGA80660.1 inosine/xanthosine triphosphate pyrophosphatase,all-alpha NTP-PPase family [Candidatus Nanohalobium constans]